MCYKCGVRTKTKQRRGSATPFSYRPAQHLAGRFYDVVEASKRTKASIVHESLENTLPILEAANAQALATLKRKAKG